MGRYLLVAALIGLSACAWFKSEQSSITADVVGEVDCVEAQLLAGNDTFEGIAAACAPALVADVVTIVTAELSKDAGVTPVATAAAKVHHAGVQ